LRGNVRVMIFITFLAGVVLLAMAIETQFFANLILSKIFCIFSGIIFMTPLPMALFYIKM